jgi:rhamnosyltransferase
MSVVHIPHVAVLLAAYNGMQWIEEQVSCILKQHGVEVTLFISVDLSSDGTDRWVAALAEKHPNVILLPYGECFGGAGPNFFRLLKDVDLSCFEAVSFADQDDIWFPDKLQRACTLLREGHCDVYSSNVIGVWPNGKQVLVDKAQPQKEFDHFFEAAGPGCTYVFNAASASAFKHFLIELDDMVQAVSLHDWFAYAFCRHNGFKWFIDPKPSMYYRQHGGNQFGINTGLAAYKKRFELLVNQWYRNQVNLIVSLVAPEQMVNFNQYFFRLFYFRDMRRKSLDAYALLATFVLGFY